MEVRRMKTAFSKGDLQAQGLGICGQEPFGWRKIYGHTRARKICDPAPKSPTKPHPFFFWHLSILQRKGKNASARNCRSVAHQLELQTPGQARGKRQVSQAPWISSNGNKVTKLKDKTDLRSIKGMWEAPFQESTSSLSSLYLATSWHIFFTCTP